MTDHPLLAIARLVATQDNACTAHPIPTVQRLETIYGMDSGYADKHAWIDDCSEVVTEGADELERKYQDGIDTEPFTRVGIQTQWEHVETFFTVAAAEAFIAKRAGRNEKLRVYIESAHRNPELREIRDYLLAIAKEEART